MKKIVHDTGVSVSSLQRYRRKHNLGVRDRPYQNGPEHHQWKGGRHVSSNGYIVVNAKMDDPIARAMTPKGYNNSVFEHRLVMAHHLGRSLTSKESVHHINGDRQDNRLENLELRSGMHGRGIRLKCLQCGSFNIEPIRIEESENE